MQTKKIEKFLKIIQNFSNLGMTETLKLLEIGMKMSLYVEIDAVFTGAVHDRLFEVPYRGGGTEVGPGEVYR